MIVPRPGLDMKYELAAELRYFWLKQLKREYQSICWQHGLKLNAPIIEITQATSYFGQWNGRQRKIAISETLIQKFSWDVVCNVLRHEMAHQICDELFKDPSAGHGPLFQKACIQAGVPAPFRTSSGDLPEGQNSWHLKPGKEFLRVKEKIEKLLNLAQSENENEAALSMQKAKELMDRFNIESEAFIDRDNYTYCIVDPKKKRLGFPYTQITPILTNHYSVEAIYSDRYSAEDNCIYKVIELLGTPENVKNAEYVLFFLLQTLERLWKTQKMETTTTRYSKRSYQQGILQGFKQKLEEPTPLWTEKSKALVKLENKYLREYCKFKHPRLGFTRSYSRSRTDSHFFNKGILAGARLKIHKGLSKNSKTQLHLKG